MTRTIGATAMVESFREFVMNDREALRQMMTLLRSIDIQASNALGALEAGRVPAALSIREAQRLAIEGRPRLRLVPQLDNNQAHR